MDAISDSDFAVSGMDSAGAGRMRDAAINSARMFLEMHQHGVVRLVAGQRGEEAPGNGSWFNTDRRPRATPPAEIVQQVAQRFVRLPDVSGIFARSAET